MWKVHLLKWVRFMKCARVKVDMCNLTSEVGTLGCIIVFAT